MSLTITIIKGGMREFEETGIYPEYLLFNLPGTRKSWRIKLRNKKQEGVLKSKGVIVYHYKFDGNFCSYRKVKEAGNLSKWIEPDCISIEMRD